MIRASGSGIASASRADLSRLAKLGYSVLTVDGRADDVKIQGFVVNARRSAFDLSVFGFAPQEILAAP